MQNKLQRKRGKRGGQSARNAELRDVHAKIRGNAAHNLHNTSVTALIMDRAKHYECSTIEETAETHIIPRESLTGKLGLRLFPQVVEVAKIPTRVMEWGVMVEKPYYRVTWRSDKTLLYRDKPGDRMAQLKRGGMVAEGLNTRKYIQFIPEDKFPMRYNSEVKAWFCNTCDKEDRFCECGHIAIDDDSLLDT